MIVTFIHQDYMVGEHARCLYKPSQALEQEIGKELEAMNMLRTAEELYFSRAENPKPSPTEDDYDSLEYCIWR